MAVSSLFVGFRDHRLLGREQARGGGRFGK